VYAASDLNDFLACEHRTALALRALTGGIAIPEEDATLAVIARKGREHEQAALVRYEAQGRAVVRIDEGDGSPGSARAAAAETERAMRSGADAIYQATLAHGAWSGRADFLLRTEVPSALGGWSYDVADAKLAVREKPAFLVQLCLYADLVAQIQGRLPAQIVALLGDGRELPYDPARYLPYVRTARARFEARVAQLDADRIPDRIGACGTCAWQPVCDARRTAVDHLSQVAGIRRSQIARLATSGITTLAALADSDDAARPQAMAEATFVTLQRQAALQAAQRATGTPDYELLEPRLGAGFALLPAPAEGDVYFDMEGDPFYEPGRSLEYLFGAYVATGEGGYASFWGETRDQERAAFEGFVDWLRAHRQRYPQAHVYHYAAYEKSALRRLAMQHGTREAEVDALLRGQVLVDLYAVVKGALAQSHDSYSIKKLEKFYGFGRTADVRAGDESIVVFERYLLERDARLRADIITYNEEDCVSTHRLHRWLLALRDEAATEFGEIPFRAPVDPREPTEQERRKEALLDDLARALLASAPEGDPRRLVAHLLAYHRREDKPVWWRMFDRIERHGAYDPVDDDTEALGGLVLCADVAPELPAGRKKRTTYTYEFPAQQHRLGAGDDVLDAATGEGAGTIDAIDEDARRLRLSLRPGVPQPAVLIPGGPIRTQAQRDALQRFGSAVLDGSAPTRYAAAWELVRAQPPRLRGVLPGHRVQPDLRAGAEAIDCRDVAALALALDRSTLVVQGPPGTGKTYAGGEIIATLLAAGKRVGVTATGHHAIHNVLAEVERAAVARGETFRGVKRGDATRPETQYHSPLGLAWIDNAPANAPFAEYALVAGTSWLISHEDLAKLDVLVIDEAGQVALADAVAMATNAESLVLLGDPLQLAQVSLAEHPEQTGASVLGHLLGNRGTVPEDRGVFLDRTFRMHPALCEFISQLVYGGRLHAAAACARQRLDAPWFAGAGLGYVPVEHADNAQRSSEEAQAVVEIVEGLVGGTFTAADGATRPLTPADILVVSPYNAQVSLVRAELRGRFGGSVRVGTVDKFQGQEAPVVIYTLAASSAEDAPRGADFLLEENRFNVAVSRGRALAVLVCSPRILATPCSSVEQLGAVAAFCAFVERATA
jgi:predicted RecB family nuclease